MFLKFSIVLSVSFFESNLYFGEIYYEMCDNFNIDIDILHLGGPEFCQGDFPNNYTFDENNSPRINKILCGVPQPVVEAEFTGKTVHVQSARVNTYTHNYTLLLPKLTQKTCGGELIVTATENNKTLTRKVQIFIRNCKYNYYVNFIFIFFFVLF